MKYLSFTILLLSLAFTSFSQSKTALFNGQNFNGWYAFEAKSGIHQDASDLFTIEDEMMRFHGKKIAYLMTERSYEGFLLTLEFRWNIDTTFVRKSHKKNSGVMYLIPEGAEDKLWPKGIQFQIKEGNTGDLILLDGFALDVKNSNPAGKNIVAPRLKDVSSPVGEWNTLSIISKNGKVIQKLNGQVVNKGKSPCASSGKILLQYEGFPIDFRNVLLEEY